MFMETSSNQEKNRMHYEKKYAGHSVENILFWLHHLDEFLMKAKSTETSWFGIYKDNFERRIKGKKVLELGCGDCTNAAIMAALGAEVYANDIADSSGNIIKGLNESYNFKHPIIFVDGDFLQKELSSKQFDFIVGKAFLHHLEVPIEKLFLQETARLLKPTGEARFFEPAVNNRILDEIRWYFPVPGRPSKFFKASFKKWKEEDPHPERSFSSTHFEKAGEGIFQMVKTIPIGAIERFHRILPRNRFNKNFRQWALKNEKFLPKAFNRTMARSQLILYKGPLL